MLAQVLFRTRRRRHAEFIRRRRDVVSFAGGFSALVRDVVEGGVRHAREDARTWDCTCAGSNYLCEAVVTAAGGAGAAAAWPSNQPAIFHP